MALAVLHPESGRLGGPEHVSGEQGIKLALQDAATAIEEFLGVEVEAA